MNSRVVKCSNCGTEYTYHSNNTVCPKCNQPDNSSIIIAGVVTFLLTILYLGGGILIVLKFLINQTSKFFTYSIITSVLSIFILYWLYNLDKNLLSSDAVNYGVTLNIFYIILSLYFILNTDAAWISKTIYFVAKYKYLISFSIIVIILNFFTYNIYLNKINDLETNNTYYLRDDNEFDNLNEKNEQQLKALDSLYTLLQVKRLKFTEYEINLPDSIKNCVSYSSIKSIKIESDSQNSEIVNFLKENIEERFEKQIQKITNSLYSVCIDDKRSNNLFGNVKIFKNSLPFLSVHFFFMEYSENIDGTWYYGDYLEDTTIILDLKNKRLVTQNEISQIWPSKDELNNIAHNFQASKIENYYETNNSQFQYEQFDFVYIFDNDSMKIRLNLNKQVYEPENLVYVPVRKLDFKF